MTEDSGGLLRRSSRFHIIANPPPYAQHILQSLGRMWPRRVGKRGISKNEVRGVIQRISDTKLGGTDEIVRCLTNAGVLISSVDDGADSYYIDPVQVEYIVDLLKRGVRAGYADPAQDHVDQRRQSLHEELLAMRTKNTSDELRRSAEQLRQDMLRLQADMGEFLTGRG